MKYKGFTKGENTQVRCSAGLAILFKTNSTVISVLTDLGYINRGVNTLGVSLRGYDLYIKKDGKVYKIQKRSNGGFSGHYSELYNIFFKN